LKIYLTKITLLTIIFTLSINSISKSICYSYTTNNNQYQSSQDSTRILKSLFSDIQFGSYIGQLSEKSYPYRHYLKYGFSLNPYISKYFGFILNWSHIPSDNQSHEIIIRDPPLIYKIPSMDGVTMFTFGFRIDIPIKRASFLVELYGLNRNNYFHKKGSGINIGLQYLVSQHFYLSAFYESNIYNFNLVEGDNTDLYNGYHFSLQYGLKKR
jgi:hypothetical protein